MSTARFEIIARPLELSLQPFKANGDPADEPDVGKYINLVDYQTTPGSNSIGATYNTANWMKIGKYGLDGSYDDKGVQLDISMEYKDFTPANEINPSYTWRIKSGSKILLTVADYSLELMAMTNGFEIPILRSANTGVGTPVDSDDGQTVAHKKYELDTTPGEPNYMSMIARGPSPYSRATGKHYQWYFPMVYVTSSYKAAFTKQDVTMIDLEFTALKFPGREVATVRAAT